MKLIKAATYNEMSKIAANILAAQITLKPDSVLGLATGSSPIGLYKELVAKYNDGALDFSGISTVNLDEYKGITKDNDQSYYYFMNDNLFDHVNINKENTNIPDGMAADPEKECENYEALIKELGGVDLQLLGMGRNGHIGFNEPSDSFDKMTHIADLKESTIEANKRFFASADDVPKQAFSMGIGTIMSAKKIVVVVSGADKADALQKSVEGPVTPQVPGSILQFHPDVTIICDAEAASKLTK